MLKVKRNSSHVWGFLLTVHIWQRWTWQISEITLSWSSRWGGLSRGGWLTSPIRSTSWSRWSRPSRRASGGGGLSRWGRLCCDTCEMLGRGLSTHLSSLYEQVIHNWTIPLHGERSDQILLTKTFEMLSRYSGHHTVDLNVCLASISGGFHDCQGFREGGGLCNLYICRGTV